MCFHLPKSPAQCWNKQPGYSHRQTAHQQKIWVGDLGRRFYRHSLFTGCKVSHTSVCDDEAPSPAEQKGWGVQKSSCIALPSQCTIHCIIFKSTSGTPTLFGISYGFVHCKIVNSRPLKKLHLDLTLAIKLLLHC